MDKYEVFWWIDEDSFMDSEVINGYSLAYQKYTSLIKQDMYSVLMQKKIKQHFNLTKIPFNEAKEKIMNNETLYCSKKEITYDFNNFLTSSKVEYIMTPVIEGNYHYWVFELK